MLIYLSPSVYLFNAPLTWLQTFIQRNHTTILANINIHTAEYARPVGGNLVSVGVGIGQCWSWEVLSLQLWRHIPHKLLAWNDRARLIPFQSEWPSISTIIGININQSINCSTKRMLFAQPENTIQLPILTVFAMLCYQLWVLNWRYFIYIFIYLSVC